MMVRVGCRCIPSRTEVNLTGTQACPAGFRWGKPAVRRLHLWIRLEWAIAIGRDHAAGRADPAQRPEITSGSHDSRPNQRTARQKSLIGAENSANLQERPINLRQVDEDGFGVGLCDPRNLCDPRKLNLYGLEPRTASFERKTHAAGFKSR